MLSSYLTSAAFGIPHRRVGTSYGHSSNPRASSGHRRCGGRIGKSCPLAVSVLFSSHFAADVIDVLQMPIDLIVKIDDCLGPRHFTSSAPAVQIATSYSSCFSHTLCVVSPRSAISASLKSPNGQQPGTYHSQTLASPRIATNRPIHGRRGKVGRDQDHFEPI